MQILQVWKWRYNHKNFAWAEAEEQDRKLSPTEKDELVRLHTLEKKSIVELAAAFGVKRGHVKYLIRKFKRKGEKKEKSERQILKELVVSKFRSGELKSGTALADYFGLNCRTVQRRIRSAKLNASAYHDLVSEEEAGKIMRPAEKTKLTHKAVIKNWVVREFGLKNRSHSNLVRLVDEIHVQGVPIKEACQWLQICRSSYYRWEQGDTRSSDDLTVEQIRIFQEAHNYAYCAKRMAVHLSRLNHMAVNHKRV